ncbi:MAG TPA: DNA-processing protein DprA [Thermoanaerobaculia bacterium]|nr:DNA-processing protein DprA [Thermoanaerobaculia bacterium]
MLSPPSPRELLIALNVQTSRIWRPALYCLGCEAKRRWQGYQAGALPPPAPAWSEWRAWLRSLATTLPRAQLERALAALPSAAVLAARECGEAGRRGARIVTLLDLSYPPALADLDLAPPVLALRGELPPGPAVAIVGSRLADAYGREVAEDFARALAAAGVTVVSGFAQGIDAAAHRGALTAAGGTTVAVLGCGVGVSYPSGHSRLADAIAERGALVSEFPCGTRPRAGYFPIRNRTIAALAVGTLVVQAARRSGSLSTARHARDLGRDLYAVPGNIFSRRSVGPHSLLRHGALLVDHPDVLLERLRQLGLRDPPDRPPGGPTRIREARPQAAGGLDGPGGAGELAGLPARVLAALPPGSTLAPEQIVRQLRSSLDRVLAALLELELEGRLERLPGALYSRKGRDA